MFKYNFNEFVVYNNQSFLVAAEHPQDLTITTSPSPTLSQHTYHVVCRKLGQQQLVFTIGNGPTTKNHIPANEATTRRYNHNLLLTELCLIMYMVI